MMNTTTLNTQNNTLGHAKRAFTSLVIVIAATLTFLLVATPKTAQAFNLDELTTLVDELTSETTEIVVADASESTEDMSFEEQMILQTDTMREVGETINSKKGDIEGIANEINGETKSYVDEVEGKGFMEGVNFETLKNAFVAAKNGEEVTSQYELINTGLQIAGLQSPENVVMEAVVTIARGILGLILVASLFGLAKHQINKQMYDY